MYLVLYTQLYLHLCTEYDNEHIRNYNNNYSYSRIIHLQRYIISFNAFYMHLK